MAELDIDQSNLPRVREVRQSFAVREDGALAHNLQEQEIEQYYSSNIQKNQLVQNDIRVAKRLQGEEVLQREQHRTLLQQTSRRLEEQDSEYARLIQEELRRCAEETRRREQEDEEIAKRIQEDEEQRGRSRGQERLSDDEDNSPTVPSPPRRHTHGRLSPLEAQHRPPAATRWRHSDPCDAENLRRVFPPKETTPRSNEGRRVCARGTWDEWRQRLSEDSEDSDAVFYERSDGRSRRWQRGADTAPCRRRASVREAPTHRKYRSLQSDGNVREEEEEEEEDGWDGYVHYDAPEARRPRNAEWERNPREENGGRHGYRDDEGERRSRRCSRSQSVRLPDRRRDSDAARTWFPRETPDRHVRFQDERRYGLQGGHHDNNSSSDAGVWEMLGQVLRERGVVVRHGAPPPAVLPPPPPTGRQSWCSQVHHGSEASYGDPQPHQRVFERSSSTRRSYYGSDQEARRCSTRTWSEGNYSGGQERQDGRPAPAADGGAPRSPEGGREPELAKRRERGGSRRWRRGEPRPGGDDDDGGEEARGGAGSTHGHRVGRSTSERWHRHKGAAEAEEEVRRDDEGPRVRVPRRSMSMRVSTRVGWRPTTAGHTLPPPQPRDGCLDLGTLQQVLQDEELARRLQEQEERRMRRGRDAGETTRNSYHEGDFRVAQVAQDEEIARFIQKQEIKSKRRSRELEGPASWREHREMISDHERRASSETQSPSPQERQDSEGLPSPTEDQPPSPVSTMTQAQQIRNIAEELDPTFRTRQQGESTLRTGPTSTGRPSCQVIPVSQVGSSRDALEEPAFIPPTKRPQSDKSGRAKPKEKKENCKQQ